MITPIIALMASVLCGSLAAVEPPAPFGACPTPAQVTWHEMEFYGFFHFTTNTFTDREWGNGDEPESVFNPTALDCRQWAKVARDCGMKGMILTAKHHDGFCLWPSKYTQHSVANSPWKGGKGDVVREVADAAKEAGLKLGLYLSPWDRNHADYGKREYIAYYRDQWRELIGNYGPLFEAWFDGANGGDGYYGGVREKRTIDGETYYGWEDTNKQLMGTNPGLIIFSDAGPGCRWVGNESGYSDETSWQTINLDGMYPGKPHDHLARGDQGGSDWVGVEVDVSIRPGWFYHASEDEKVKTPEQLVELWYKSVGRGGNLLLNLPPDRRGLIHENDVKSLVGMRRILDGTFAADLARSRSAEADNTRGNDPAYGAPMALDNNPNTYWATDDDAHTGTLTVDLGKPTALDVVKVREFIPLGQRVEAFVVEYRDGADWKKLCEGTTIGPRRIIRTDPVTTQKVRLRITKSGACPLISEFSLFKRP